MASAESGLADIQDSARSRLSSTAWFRPQKVRTQVNIEIVSTFFIVRCSKKHPNIEQKSFPTKDSNAESVIVNGRSRKTLATTLVIN